MSSKKTTNGKEDWERNILRGAEEKKIDGKNRKRDNNVKKKNHNNKLS